ADSHEAIDGIGIVVVQPLQVTRSERASIGLAISHGDSPSGSLAVRPRPLGGPVRWLLRHAATPAREGEPDRGAWGSLSGKRPASLSMLDILALHVNLLVLLAVLGCLHDQTGA